jgi:hypothetical protein
VTLGEAAGENLHFMANAIGEGGADGWICEGFVAAPGNSDEIGDPIPRT